MFSGGIGRHMVLYIFPQSRNLERHWPMHITQKPVKLCLAQLGFLVKHNHKFQHAGSAPSTLKTRKEKKRPEKLLTAKFAKEARRSQRKEPVKIFISLTPEASSLPGTHAQNYMHG